MRRITANDLPTLHDEALADLLETRANVITLVTDEMLGEMPDADTERYLNLLRREADMLQGEIDRRADHGQLAVDAAWGEYQRLRTAFIDANRKVRRHERNGETAQRANAAHWRERIYAQSEGAWMAYDAVRAATGKDATGTQ